VQSSDGGRTEQAAGRTRDEHNRSTTKRSCRRSGGRRGGGLGWMDADAESRSPGDRPAPPFAPSSLTTDLALRAAGERHGAQGLGQGARDELGCGVEDPIPWAQPD